MDKLPEVIRKEVENRLLEGHTYEEIAKYLKEMGHNISKTSIHRYGKPFLQKFESVRLAKEYAQLLAEDNTERPTTELHEANNALISQMIMQVLINENIKQNKIYWEISNILWHAASILRMFRYKELYYTQSMLKHSEKSSRQHKKYGIRNISLFFLFQSNIEKQYSFPISAV